MVGSNAPLLVCFGSVGSEFPLPDGEADRVINAPVQKAWRCEPRTSAILDEHASTYVRAQTYAHSCQTSGGPTSTRRLPHCRRWTGQQILAPAGGHARPGAEADPGAARRGQMTRPFVIGEVPASSSRAAIARHAFGDRQVPDQTERDSCFHVGAVLSTDAADTLEFVLTHAHVACPPTTATPGLRW